MEEYEYLSTLGEGAYGSVWKCVERATGRFVAIKGFKQAHVEPEIMRMAVREVRVLQTLQHPAIIPLIDAFRSKSGRVYMVFPYIGRSAFQEIDERQEGLPAPRLKLLAWQLLHALTYLHRLKVVHRDVKPANILLSEADEVKLCDFGFARTTHCGPRDVEPLTSYVVTRWYRAPEVLVGEPYGPSSDIWSLGCTLAELATGQPLFPGKSTGEQLWRIMRCFGPLSRSQAARLASDSRLARVRVPVRGRPLHERLQDCGDPALLQLLESCLQLDPSRRPKASELLRSPYFADVPNLIEGTPLEQMYGSQQQLPYDDKDLQQHQQPQEARERRWPGRSTVTAVMCPAPSSPGTPLDLSSAVSEQRRSDKPRPSAPEGSRGPCRTSTSFSAGGKARQAEAWEEHVQDLQGDAETEGDDGDRNSNSSLLPMSPGDLGRAEKRGRDQRRARMDLDVVAAVPSAAEETNSQRQQDQQQQIGSAGDISCRGALRALRTVESLVPERFVSGSAGAVAVLEAATEAKQAAARLVATFGANDDGVGGTGIAPHSAPLVADAAAGAACAPVSPQKPTTPPPPAPPLLQQNRRRHDDVTDAADASGSGGGGGSGESFGAELARVLLRSGIPPRRPASGAVTGSPVPPLPAPSKLALAPHTRSAVSVQVSVSVPADGRSGSSWQLQLPALATPSAFALLPTDTFLKSGGLAQCDTVLFEACANAPPDNSARRRAGPPAPNPCRAALDAASMVAAADLCDALPGNAAATSINAYGPSFLWTSQGYDSMQKNLAQDIVREMPYTPMPDDLLRSQAASRFPGDGAAGWSPKAAASSGNSVVVVDDENVPLAASEQPMAVVCTNRSLAPSPSGHVPTPPPLLTMSADIQVAAGVGGKRHNTLQPGGGGGVSGGVSGRARSQLLARPLSPQPPPGPRMERGSATRASASNVATNTSYKDATAAAAAACVSGPPPPPPRTAMDPPTGIGDRGYGIGSTMLAWVEETETAPSCDLPLQGVGVGVGSTSAAAVPVVLRRAGTYDRLLETHDSAALVQRGAAAAAAPAASPAMVPCGSGVLAVGGYLAPPDISAVSGGSPSGLRVVSGASARVAPARMATQPAGAAAGAAATGTLSRSRLFAKVSNPHFGWGTDTIVEVPTSPILAFQMADGAQCSETPGAPPLLAVLAATSSSLQRRPVSAAGTAAAVSAVTGGKCDSSSSAGGGFGGRPGSGSLRLHSKRPASGRYDGTAAAPKGVVALDDGSAATGKKGALTRLLGAVKKALSGGAKKRPSP